MALPLLRFAQTLYPDADFSDVGVIACQHLLGTTVDVFDAFFAKGLRPENVHVIGKCYSTHKGTMRKLARRGVHVSPLGTAFDPTRSYDGQFAEYTATFFDDAMAALAGVRRIVVLDEGGFLLERANARADAAERFVGVEQTSSGFRRIRDTALRFPVVNVARSEAKLRYESPFIAADVIRVLKKSVRLRASTRVLVVGQGAIGREVKAQLQGKCAVYGCDADAARCDFDGAFAAQLHTFDVIIGTTGAEALTVDDCARLRSGAVLASASSSDREFPAVVFRRAQPHVDDCHAEARMHGVRLLNAGFPVNFTGHRHGIAPRKIQLTRALLFAGVCEALVADGAGLHDLSEKQFAIVAAFRP